MCVQEVYYGSMEINMKNILITWGYWGGKQREQIKGIKSWRRQAGEVHMYEITFMNVCKFYMRM